MDIDNFRGILSDAILTEVGNLTGTLISEDFCAGEEGRNLLLQGHPIYTSSVVKVDIVEGQLVVFTRNSAYVIEGELKTMYGLIFGG